MRKFLFLEIMLLIFCRNISPFSICFFFFKSNAQFCIKWTISTKGFSLLETGLGPRFRSSRWWWENKYHLNVWKKRNQILDPLVVCTSYCFSDLRIGFKNFSQLIYSVVLQFDSCPSIQPLRRFQVQVQWES